MRRANKFPRAARIPHSGERALTLSVHHAALHHNNYLLAAVAILRCSAASARSSFAAAARSDATLLQCLA